MVMSPTCQISHELPLNLFYTARPGGRCDGCGMNDIIYIGIVVAFFVVELICALSTARTVM